MKIESLDLNAFSHGQIVSKIWLCEELEKYASNCPNIVYILGCWYNVTGFLLESRGKINIERLHGIDIDPAAITIAKEINSAWVYPYKHRYSVEDASTMHWPSGCSIVINTSAEHFNSSDWYHRVPKGSLVAIQESCMPSDVDFGDQLYLANRPTLEDFDQIYPMSDVKFLGEKLIEYPSWSYTRYMKIGIV